MTVNARVKKLRKALNLSQTEFGKKLGVSKDVIANIELERVEIKELTINLICRTYNVNPLWLAEGEGDIFIETSESIIEDLASEYNLTDTEKKIVSNFIKLPPEERKTVIDIIKKIIT